MYKDKKSRNGRLPSSKQTRCAVGSKYSCSLELKLCYILTMAQSMKKEIRKTFGFAREKFSAKVRLDTKMPGVPIILSKSVYIDIYWVCQYFLCHQTALDVCVVSHLTLMEITLLDVVMVHIV